MLLGNGCDHANPHPNIFLISTLQHRYLTFTPAFSTFQTGADSSM